MTNKEMTSSLNILIAAMGGEGGGVLMDWIVKTAIAAGLPVQATSIPGVAQRTGATTYYIEIWPERLDDDASKRPIFSLSPAIGEIDIMIATELAEGARALGNGFITPNRTTLISSTHRVFLTLEKMAMGDGRLDDKKLYAALKRSAKKSVMFDASEVAAQHNTIINAVLLGALAGTGALPFEPDAYTASIEAEGKSIEPNLAGFRAGLENSQAGSKRFGQDIINSETGGKVALNLETRINQNFPAETRDIIIHGVNRLTDYQNTAYAERYLDRLTSFAEIDSGLCRELGRHLAVRMSFEDIIRVAQAKVRENRFNRIRRELGAMETEPYHITDFFKPGIREFCDLLPPALAKTVLSWAERYGYLDTFYWGMQVRTTSILGFLKIWFLSKLRWWRPRSYRWSEEQKQIDDWLTLVKNTAENNIEIAREVVELARLIKGYGSTHRRGLSNFGLIVDTYVTPLLNDPGLLDGASSSIKEAREAALADPEGEALKMVLEDNGQREDALAAE